MLNISRKISRKEFPPFNAPSILWKGEVLKFRVIKKKNDKAQFAIILSKKMYQTKPSRNLFKRRVFSELRLHLHKLDTNPHGYFVISPVIHTEKITFISIKKDIENFLDYIVK